MNLQRWQNSPVTERVRALRWALPLAIVAVVGIYQLIFAAYVHDHFGHSAHTLMEVIFYGLLGPVVSWATLNQIGRWLTEKEEAERAARAHERHLATITNASADAILSLDQNGLIRSWNRGASALFGFVAEEMIGRPLSDLLTIVPRSGSAKNAPSPSGAIEGVLRHYEGVCTTKNGRHVIVDVTQTPLSDDSHRLMGASVILRDITQRKAREAALEEERARIARDLHDGLAQGLYFMGLKLDYVRKQVTRDPAAAEQELRTLKETIQTNIQDVRRTIFALRPVDLEGLGFEAAVRKYVREFGEQTNLNVSVTMEGFEESIPPALEPEFFRLIQEGLNNIAKHAHANHARITLTIGPQHVGCLSIEDDGTGFDPAAVDQNGGGKMGLRQMKERVESLQGHFSVETRPGQGTKLYVEIPL
jgi:PAS domain S-box-containing protein